MTPHSDADDLRPRERLSPEQTSLALLADLEISLKTTQKALVARDLAGLEQGTREQMRLERELRNHWIQISIEPQGRRASETVPMLPQTPFTEELRHAAWRVLALGRTQAALLVRARRRLRTTAHLLAGTNASYGPGAQLTPQHVPAPSITSGSDPGGKTPCRV